MGYYFSGACFWSSSGIPQLSFAKGILKKTLDTGSCSDLVCGVLGTFLLPYGFYLLGMESQPLNPLTGQLTTPEINVQKPFVLNLGSNTLIQNVSALTQGVNLRRFIDFGCDYPIQIKFKDGQLLISALIMNQKW